MNLVDRAKNIIMTPKTEWPVIAAEEPNTNRDPDGLCDSVGTHPGDRDSDRYRIDRWSVRRHR